VNDDRRKRECGHCGRTGASAWAPGVHLCHTDDPSRPDCYRRVTVYAEPVGALLAADPVPWGVGGILRLDDAGRLIPAAAVALTALTEELGLYGGG
jgi:hypothetical protein